MKKRENVAIRLTVIYAMLVAISIVCGKFIPAFDAGGLRISLENMPIIFAGVAFGPIAGVTVGLTADIIGCFLRGYALIPTVTIGAGLVGFISGLVFMLLKKRVQMPLNLVLSVVLAHFTGSILVKTVGLAKLMNTPYLVLMGTRCLNYLFVGIVDGLIVFLLLKSKPVMKEIEKIRLGLKFSKKSKDKTDSIETETN